MDHQRNGAVNFTGVDVLVLDEADRMMDMGFWPDVRRIVSTVPPSETRQTLLFSATMPDEVMKLADEVVREPSTSRSDRPADRHEASRTRSRPCRRPRRPNGWRSSCGGPKDRFWCSCGPSTAPSGWRASSQASVCALRRCTRIARSSSEPRGRGLSRRPVSRARRDRCRGSRPGHRRHHARRELRSPLVAGNLCAPRRSYRSRRGDRHGAHARRARGAPRARSAAAFHRTGIARMMDDTNPFDPTPQPPAGRDAPEPRVPGRCVEPVAGRREIQVVPLARDAGTGRVLHPPRRAAVRRQGRVQPRFVVPGMQLLQAATDTKEARTVGILLLTDGGWPIQPPSVNRDRYSENSLASSTHSPFGARSW